MNEPLIYKPELLVRLNEIYYQLEKLEDVVHSSFIEQQEYVHHLQEERLGRCTRKMTALENSLNQKIVEKSQLKPIMPKPCQKTAGISLNLV